MANLGLVLLLCRPLRRAKHAGNSVIVRLASTSSKNRFPFPTYDNPTPHEIFHLPHGASQNEIKKRYYELVKVYHPDAAHDRQDIPSSIRNAQFRTITHAYGILRGRTSMISPGPAWDYRDEAMRAELRRRSGRSRPSSTTMAPTDARHDSAGDVRVWYSLVSVVLLGAIVAMGSVSYHMDRVERHTRSAAANLAQARAEAQLYGMERRRKIRERVRSLHNITEIGSDPLSCREMSVESVLDKK